MLGPLQHAAGVFALPGPQAGGFHAHIDKVRFATVCLLPNDPQDVAHVREELVPVLDPWLAKPRRVLPEKA